MSYLIECHKVCKDYTIGNNVLHALKDINLQITAGEMVAIMGPSGSGKSSLMNIIGLLDKPTSGQYTIDNKATDMRHDNELSELRGNMIGFVFQSFCLLPRLAAWRNVAMPLLYKGLSQAQSKQRAYSTLARVDMEGHAHHKPMELSGGQQQRVAIARALIANPQVLLANEPTGALDSKTSNEVMRLFRQLNTEDNVTCIVITHDPLVAEKCDRIIRIEDGKLLC